MNKPRFYIFLTLFLYSTNLHPIEISLSNYFSSENGNKISSFIIKATNSTKYFINSSLEESRNFIDHIKNFNKKDKLNTALTVSAIATLTSITAYIINKTIINKNQNNKNNLENTKKLNHEINNIIDSINFQDTSNNQEQNQEYSQTDKSITTSLNSRKKWALWPNDMSFLTMIQIPQEIFFSRLISEIKTTYKNTNNANLDPAEQTKYAIESFIKDVDNEIAVYQKKYNIILISDNFERKEECLAKIKDNIKKLIYLKSTVISWANRA